MGMAKLLTSNEIIPSNEDVYRSVLSGHNLYRIENGKLIFSSQAFNDRNMQPSVDRASLHNNNPELTKFGNSDGVVALLTGDIRQEKVSSGQHPNIQEYMVDVIADPLPNNKAHALIVPSPEYKNKKAFDKVKIRLAYLATQRGWIAEPEL